MPRQSTAVLKKLKKSANKENVKIKVKDVLSNIKKAKKGKIKKFIVTEEVESEGSDDDDDDIEVDNDNSGNYKENSEDDDEEDNENNNNNEEEEEEDNKEEEIDINNNSNVHILSEYEMQRQENIKRNESFLNSMGLGTLKESICINNNNNNNNKKVKNKSIVKNDIIQTLPTRRSRRNQEDKGSLILVDGGYVGIEDNGEDNEYNIVKKEKKQSNITVILDDDNVIRNPITPHSLREFIDNLSIDHSNNISNAAIIHCVYRVSTMSNKALGTRIKMVSSGAGKKSKEKLLVFYYALFHANLIELSNTVKKALENTNIW